MLSPCLQALRLLCLVGKHNLKKYFSLKHLNKILHFILKDKKNNSKRINLVLLKKIGQPIFDQNFKIQDLKLFLKEELIN